MILIAMGANLPHPKYGDPLNTLVEARKELVAMGLDIVGSSSWYRTAPVPISDQPWFVNSVLWVSSNLAPESLLTILHEVEEKFGRVRVDKWEARLLDLDLVAYNDRVTENQHQAEGLVLPHPHMHERAFVMVPITELDPGWMHPRLQKTAEELAKLTAGDQAFEVVRSDLNPDSTALP
mgnify:CR=1 FL=1